MAMTQAALNATALTESGQEPVVTKYYFHGGRPVAMDRDLVQYLVGDHGSSPWANCTGPPSSTIQRCQDRAGVL